MVSPVCWPISLGDSTRLGERLQLIQSLGPPECSPVAGSVLLTASKMKVAESKSFPAELVHFYKPVYYTFVAVSRYSLLHGLQNNSC